jgi:CheY-like chemotaxis protein
VLIEIIKTIPNVFGIIVLLIIILILKKPIVKILSKASEFEFKGLGFEFKVISEILEKAAKKNQTGSSKARDQVIRRAELIKNILNNDIKILLVNDQPYEMKYIVGILKNLNIHIDITKNTKKAIEMLAKNKYTAIISDMKRGNIDDEGLNFLKEIRIKNFYTPTIFTVGNYKPDKGTPPYAFGITNKVDELLNLLFDIIERKYL